MRHISVALSRVVSRYGRSEKVPRAPFGVPILSETGEIRHPIVATFSDRPKRDTDWRRLPQTPMQYTAGRRV